MNRFLDPASLADYRLFLKIKSLPRYEIVGHMASFPDEYASILDMGTAATQSDDYQPSPFLFDYQRDIARLAIRKKKFAVFAQCGLGKTLILLEYARHVASTLSPGRCVLIVAPLMVCPQTVAEARRFYGDSLPIEQVRARDLPTWLVRGRSQIGITNYEALTEAVSPGRLAALIVDESSVMKSHYGSWASRLIELGSGLDWKLCLTGTPAPNDRIEYGNHAVFLDQFPTVNAFLARYFVNRGQTDNRWELKPHALRPFYRSLSHWCIFLESPATYGWQDNIGVIPPINVHIHDVELTAAQRERVSAISGDLYGNPGGITSRAKLAQLAKGRFGNQQIDTAKPAYIRDLIATWPDESTIVWCRFNHEQEAMERALPGALSISGDTPDDARADLIGRFQRRESRVLITKPRILGFGLNLQVVTRQVFNGLNDCYDENTELLTEDGWRLFGSVSVGDRVATLNPTSLAFEWQACERVIWEHYSGPMIHFRGEHAFDLLVTPNHKMLVQRCPIRHPGSRGETRLVRADELVQQHKRQENRLLSAASSFTGDNPISITVPINDGLRLASAGRLVTSVPAEKFMQLAGWYLSEGYCRPVGSHEFGRIAITQGQGHPEYRAEIVALLLSLGLHVNDNTKDITCYSRNLAAHLLDQFGGSSAEKRIPRWVKNLDQRLLVVLRDTLLKGDGCSNKGRFTCYRTISPRLADDFQELCLKTGVRGSVRNRGLISDLSRADCIDVQIATKHVRPAIVNVPEIVPYSGMIGCVTVPNHIVWVRRNGLAVASGNSYEEFHQAVKRSNRIGSNRPLNVHVPVTEIERAMVETVLRKAKRAQQDTEEQEALFKESGYVF